MTTRNPKNQRLIVFTFVAPLTLLVVSVIALVIINLIFNPTFCMTPDTSPIITTPIGVTVFNIIFIILGFIGLVAIIPAAILGAFLISRSKAK